MARVFELWDGASRNLIGAYESEADALAFVRAYVAEHGPGYPSSWALLWDDDAADEAGQIAEGATLLSRAGVATTPHSPIETPRRLVS
jgi:hypothetical protein